MEDQHAQRMANERLAPPATRYLTTPELETVLKLLIEVRQSTLSRKSFDFATQMICALGGKDWLPRSVRDCED